jgi:hypothetical protein
MSTFEVEPAILTSWAEIFKELADGFNVPGVSSVELGQTGDPRLAQAVEDLLQWSAREVGELVRQCGQVHDVLVASALGYGTVDQGVAKGIASALPLESAGGGA